MISKRDRVWVGGLEAWLSMARSLDRIGESNGVNQKLGSFKLPALGGADWAMGTGDSAPGGVEQWTKRGICSTQNLEGILKAKPNESVSIA